MSEYLLPIGIVIAIDVIVGAVVWGVVVLRRVVRENKKMKAEFRAGMRQLAELAAVVADQTGSPEVAQKAKAVAARLRAGATAAEGEPRVPALLGMDDAPTWEHTWAMQCHDAGWRDPNPPGEPLDGEHKKLAKGLYAECKRNGWLTPQEASA